MRAFGADDVPTADGVYGAESKDVRSSTTGKKRARGIKVENKKSWWYRKFIAARHIAKGIMNRTLKVSAV